MDKGFIRSGNILSGSVNSTLLRFALPIILGNIFQQLYNLIDAVVVGNFLGDLSLSGISVASPIMDIATALIIGGTIGIGVLIARLFGGGQNTKLKITNSTALIGGIILTFLISLIGIFISPRILTLQGTERDVCTEAMRYLRVVFLSMPFCFLYNYYASALRSCGNSSAPFLILLVSSCLHVGLDLLLVAVFHAGIVGIALSTALCQLFSAVWCILYACNKYPALSLKRGEFRYSHAEAGVLLTYAWAAALQQAVVCIGRLLIQGMLTSLGTLTVTGYNMGMRIEQFAFCFSQGVSAAMVVCISQNIGHSDRIRAGKFYKAGIRTAVCMAIVIAVIFRCFPARLITMFSDNTEVIAAGAEYIGIMSFFYLSAFVDEMIQGFFRGLGRLRLTMIASFGQIFLRVLLSVFLIPLYGISGICISVITGWLLLALAEGGYSIYIYNKSMLTA